MAGTNPAGQADRGEARLLYGETINTETQLTP